MIEMIIIYFYLKEILILSGSGTFFNFVGELSTTIKKYPVDPLKDLLHLILILLVNYQLQSKNISRLH